MNNSMIIQFLYYESDITEDISQEFLVYNSAMFIVGVYIKA